jgi:uracil-DNA glycosylase
VAGPPAARLDAPASGNAIEDAWRAYYESVFNPARLNPGAMRTEMPKRYWRNLPEALAIPGFVRSAPARLREMIEREAALPSKRDPVEAVAAMSRQSPQDLESLNRLIAAVEPLVAGRGAGLCAAAARGGARRNGSPRVDG